MQHRVIQLLRQYCLNDREVALEFVSDASVNFEHSRFDRVNYEDANINVGLPIFTIHGNHDDTAGKVWVLTILDVLHEAGLVNLFGKFSDIDQFDVSPILLRKGSTRVALFGIGSQRDDRLCRAFAGHTIRFLRPRAGYDDWFNILVLHQNRPKRSTLRSTGAYLPEQYIPTFFDLVLWGHEHESKPHCQYVASSDAAGDGFYILQPGSTIATSLTREEALQKNVFLIKVKGRKFQCKPIPLQTVRPMVVDEIILDTLPEGVRLPANGVRPSGGGFVLPIHGRQIGAKFEDQVANASEIVVTRRVIEKKKKKGGVSMEEDQGDIIDAACLDQVISEHFNKLPWEERLTVFTHPIIGKALSAFDDEEKANTAKANQEFRTALEKFGNLKSDNFEMMVRNDLNVLKRQTYGIQGGAVTNRDEFDDEMEDGA
ncbi:putative DNA repair protein [Cooperia oncophora]